MSAELAKVQTELGNEAKATSEALKYLTEQFKIESQADYETAGELAREAAKRHAFLDKKRESITKPLYQAQKATNDFFRPVLTHLQKTQDILTKKMGAYTLQVDAQRKAVMVQSSAEYQAGGTPTAIIPEPPKAEGVTIKAVWRWEIVDPAMVPRDFCSPDEHKIDAARSMSLMITDTEPPPIPGVRFYLDTQSRVSKS